MNPSNTAINYSDSFEDDDKIKKRILLGNVLNMDLSQRIENFKKVPLENLQIEFKKFLDWIAEIKIDFGNEIIFSENEISILEFAKDLGFKTDKLNLNGLLGIFELDKIYKNTNVDDDSLDLFYQAVQLFVQNFPDQKDFLCERYGEIVPLLPHAIKIDTQKNIENVLEIHNKF